ncbi:MAG: D-arabinono-1,4-lactone oxidase [Pseudomonadales bacterium]
MTDHGVKKPPPGEPWVNWGGNQNFAPAFAAEPNNEQEVCELLRWASKNDKKVRVASTGHSFSPVVETDGLLLNLGRLSGIASIDPQAKTVRVAAGSVLNTLVEPLWDAGLAFVNQGDIDKQTIGGVVATATHGSGIKFPSYSGMIRALKIATANGDVLEIDDTQADLLEAARVSLGVLGVTLEVEFQLTDAYYIQRTIDVRTWDEIIEDLDSLVSENRHFSFFWYPTQESAELFGESFPSDFPEHQFCGALIGNLAASGRENEAGVDRSYRSFVVDYPHKFIELEYYVAYERAKDALNSVREMILNRFPGKTLPMEVRFVSPESAFMSPFFERTTTVISVSCDPRQNWLEAFRAVDQVLQPFEGRAHWGKYNFMTRDRLEQLYPMYDQFCDVRNDLDPKEMFLNHHLRDLFVRS